jgi:hypothetical protein
VPFRKKRSIAIRDPKGWVQEKDAGRVIPRPLGAAPLDRIPLLKDHFAGLVQHLQLWSEAGAIPRRPHKVCPVAVQRYEPGKSWVVRAANEDRVF